MSVFRAIFCLHLMIFGMPLLYGTATSNDSLAVRLSYNDSLSYYDLIEDAILVASINLDSAHQMLDSVKADPRISFGTYLYARLQTVRSLLLADAGEYAKALIYQDSALRIQEDAERYDDIGDILRYRGRIFTNEAEAYEAELAYDRAEERYELARQYYQKALDKYMINKDSVRIASGYQNLSTAYYGLYQYDEALAAIRKSIRFTAGATKDRMLLGTWMGMSAIFYEMGEIDSSLACVEKARNKAKALNHNETLVAVSLHQASTYLELNNPDAAIAQLQQADSVLVELKDQGYKLLVCQLMTDAYELKGDYQNALNYARLYYALRDSSINSEYHSQELNVRYETNRYKEEIQRQKEEALRKELALQKTAAQKQRLQIIAGSLVLLFVLSIGVVVWRRRVLKKIQAQEIRELEQARELDTARAMLTGQEQERIRIAEDLHDRLGSTLSAAKMQMEAAVSRVATDNKFLVKSRDLIDKAIGDTREISHNMISGVLVKLGLAAALKDLKESTEVANRLEIELKVRDYQPLERNTELQLFRITQELVNNAIKHSGGTKVSISLGRKDGETFLSVADNGKGFDRQEVKEGLGLSNIERRVQAIFGLLEVNSQASGSNILIKIPA